MVYRRGKAAGHAFKWFDTASADIYPNICSLGEVPYAIDDDIRARYPNIIAADGVAFVMPRYGLIFGAEQDDDGIRRIKAHQKAVLLVTAGPGHSRTMDGIVASFRINF